jgi:hypothetical protein
VTGIWAYFKSQYGNIEQQLTGPSCIRACLGETLS